MCAVPEPGSDGPCTFRALIDQLPELVCRFTLDGTLTFVNESYAAFHESTTEDLIGRRFPDLAPDEIKPRLRDHLDSLRMDFTRVEDEGDVHFAHARGFVAKTSATDPERLRELLAKAQVS